MKSFLAGLQQAPWYIWIKNHKKTLGAATIGLTLVTLAWYIYTNPEILRKVLEITPIDIFRLTVLYSVLMGVNVAIVYVTVRLCRKELSLKNSILLSIYSSLINFFGPLQSGPGARAVYLKTKIGLGIRTYTLAMLFYYFAYASISAALIFTTTLPVLTVTGLTAGVLLTAFGAKKFGFEDRAKYIIAIYLVTVIQVLVMAFVYYVELHIVDSSATILQTLSYTGSANLALFVSLTPGAIGIREAFLVFTQSLHGIATSYIIAAGIIDRAFYTIFLIVLLLFSALFHLNDSIGVKRKQ